MIPLEELVLDVRKASRDEFIAKHPARYLVLELPPSTDQEPWAFKTSTMASQKISLARLVESGELAVSKDIERYRVFPLVKAESNPWRERISVGRARNNDVVLPDNSVSKLHAYVNFDAEHQATVRDAGSRNGTKLGETKIKSTEAVPLKVGDYVTFGALTLRLLDAGGVYDFAHSLLRSTT